MILQQSIEETMYGISSEWH